MKYKVIRPYTDKYTQESHQIGDVVDLNKTRAKVLLGENAYKQVYVELIVEE